MKFLVGTIVAIVFSYSQAEAKQCRGHIPRTDEVYFEKFNNTEESSPMRSVTLLYGVTSTMEICEENKIGGRVCYFEGRDRTLTRKIIVTQNDGAELTLAEKRIALAPASGVKHGDNCNNLVKDGTWAQIHRASTGYRQNWESQIKNDAAEVKKVLSLIGLAANPFTYW